MVNDRYELIVLRTDGSKSKYYINNLKSVKSLLNSMYCVYVNELILSKKHQCYYLFLSSYSTHSGSCGFPYRIKKYRNCFTLKKL